MEPQSKNLFKKKKSKEIKDKQKSEKEDIINPKKYKIGSFPVQKYDSKGRTYTRIRSKLEDCPLSYSLGYTQTAFLNSDYGDAVANKSISPLYGYNVNMRYTATLPMFLEMNYYNSIFNVTGDSYLDFKKDNRITFQGVDLSMSLVLLPSGGIFVPYIGVGFTAATATSGCGIYDLNSGQLKKKEFYNGIWKAGLMLNFSEYFYLYGEYRQTFDAGNAGSFNQITGGLGFRIHKDYLYNEDDQDEMRHSKLIAYYGYHQTDFQNQMFRTLLKDGQIERQYGQHFSLRIIAAYPMMFDLGVFSSQFKVKGIANWTFPDSTVIRHRGIEAAMLMPLFYATKYFTPYIGAGYQYSQLFAGAPFLQVSGQKYDKTQASINTSCPIWKTGIMITFRRFALAFEYKHSLFEQEKRFNQVATNLGWKF
jgi:hypothetical protein